MTQDQFTKLFTYMEDFRADVDRRFDRVDQKFDQVYVILDGFAGRLDIFNTELAALTSKTDRIETGLDSLRERFDLHEKYSTT